MVLILNIPYVWGNCIIIVRMIAGTIFENGISNLDKVDKTYTHRTSSKKITEMNCANKKLSW